LVDFASLIDTVSVQLAAPATNEPFSTTTSRAEIETQKILHIVTKRGPYDSPLSAMRALSKLRTSSWVSYCVEIVRVFRGIRIGIDCARNLDLNRVINGPIGVERNVRGCSVGVESAGPAGRSLRTGFFPVNPSTSGYFP
jgi:hypothetical protein